MVTDASWTDINNDNIPELILVGEWMPVTIFQKEGDEFIDITDKAGLSGEIGWWYCITSFDFDQDDDEDFVVGNLELNNKIKASREEPFEIYAKDFDNNGKPDTVIGYYQDGQLYPFHDFKMLSKQLPYLKQKYSTFDAYGKASFEDVLGKENLKKALHYKATNFATCYIENRGGLTFKVKPLCNLAQISSVNGIIAKDVDNDGFMDLVIAGNFYGFEVSIPRNDASIGLFLKGNGNGDFDPIPYHKSGLSLKGNFRDIELIKIGTEGRQGIIAVKNSDYVQIVEINTTIME